MQHKSQRLRLRDIRQSSELVREVAELGSDPTAWRTHALLGFIRLVGGQVGMTVDMEGALPGSLPRAIDPLDLGWSSMSSRGTYYNYLQTEIVEDPGAMALMQLHQKVTFLTSTRQRMVDDKTWYSAMAVSELRRSGDVDDFVLSSVSLKPGWLHGFIVYRPWGEKRFDLRERRLMRLTHVWLFRLYKTGLDRHWTLEEVRKLPPRVRQTLELLLAGDSMKRIAEKLGISVHTVNDYMKTLHQRLGVSTRTELLKKCLSYQGRPALALPRGMSPPSF
jgi:DNA-binding CsgD family transcriptional regulator